jgi:hypothetical protein
VQLTLHDPVPNATGQHCTGSLKQTAEPEVDLYLAAKAARIEGCLDILHVFTLVRSTEHLGGSYIKQAQKHSHVLNRVAN